MVTFLGMDAEQQVGHVAHDAGEVQGLHHEAALAA